MIANKITLIVIVFLLGLPFQSVDGQIQIDPRAPQYTFSGGMQPIGSQGRIDYSLMFNHYDSLELVPEQKRELDRLRQETGKANFLLNEKLIAAIKSEDQTEVMAIRARMAANQSAMTDGVEKTLLPHQLRMLNSIAFTQTIAKVGIGNIASSPIGNSLNLTDEEKKRLQEKAKEIEAELRKKIEMLRRDAVKELILELPEEKQSMLERRYSISVDSFLAK